MPMTPDEAEPGIPEPGPEKAAVEDPERQDGAF